MQSTQKIHSARWVIPISSEPIEYGAVVVDGERIVFVGSKTDCVNSYPDAPVEDWGDAAIIPGMVNCHTHLELTAMRGYLDDVENDFFAWLKKLTIARMTCMDTGDLYTSALFGALEAARAGITCVGDASSSGMESMTALQHAGLRGIVYQEVFGPDASVAEEAFDGLGAKLAAMRNVQRTLTRAGVSPHSPYTVSSPLLERVAQYSIENNIPLMIHAAESEAEESFLRNGMGPFADGLLKRGIEWSPPGMSTIRYFEKSGVLDTKPLLAHCIRVNDEDIALIKKSGSGVAHCPKSNAKLGHGRAPFELFLRADLNVGIGSDSVASNNVCDLIEESRFAALLTRSAHVDAADNPITAVNVLKAATLGGARAMHLEDSIGSLEAGKQADLAIISMDGVHQQPVFDPITTLVFSSSARDVVLTMVAGREICRNGNLTLVDEKTAKDRLEQIRGRFVA